MIRQVTINMIIIFMILYSTDGGSVELADTFLEKLPNTYDVVSSSIFPEVISTFSQRYNAEITQISNTTVRSEDRILQINVITCSDEENAQKIFQVLSAGRPFPVIQISGQHVIEFVDRGNASIHFIFETSKMLGLIDEVPDSGRYRITAELAAVEEADYMVLNPLTNQFIMLQTGAAAAQAIEELSAKCIFGNSIQLRNPVIESVESAYRTMPEPISINVVDAIVTYNFDNLPTRNGVPYVELYMEVVVDSDGFSESLSKPSEVLIAPTTFWPVDDPDIIRLSKRITEGCTTIDEKVNAILSWLVPGKNIKYEGQTGSRWGVRKVIEQQYGHCFDFSDLFVTLARASGVSCRQVGGWLYGSSGHVWAEYYNNSGWQQVDPTGGNVEIFHIPFFTSEDGVMPIMYLSMPIIEMVIDEIDNKYN